MLSVTHRGERFDDRRLLQRQPRRQDMDVLRRQLDVLAERAFDLAPEEARNAAKVAGSAHARVAAPAGDDRIDDDVLPGFTSATPSPSESITPVDSWPITTGY